MLTKKEEAAISKAINLIMASSNLNDSEVCECLELLEEIQRKSSAINSRRCPYFSPLLS